MSQKGKTRDSGNERSGNTPQKNNKYSAGSKANSGNGKAAIYEELLPLCRAEEGLRSGRFFRGVLRVNPKRRKVAYVSCDGIAIDVCIDDEKFRNRAIFGDLVAVEIFPESEWLPIVAKTFSGGGSSATENNAEILAEVDEKVHMLWQPRQDILSKYKANPLGPESCTSPAMPHPVDEASKRLNLQPKGKVVAIIETGHSTTVVGSLDPQRALHKGKGLPEDISIVFFNPSDPRYPNMVIPRIQLPEAYVSDPYSNQKQIYLATIASPWALTSKLPFGCDVRSIGEMGSIQAETEALLIENGVNHGIFSDELLEPLKALLGQSILGSKDVEGGEEDDDPISVSGGVYDRSVHWKIPEEEIAKRRDLRSYRIFTIDPPNAKDLDDALHITPNDDGTYSIGVHIADVSYFLQEGTPLDVEAKKRATSVYLVQKVVPMLPPILCEQLCSLNPNVDRLAFSCIWKMNPDGTLCDEQPWFGRTVIRSCAKLDYPTAQRMIDGIIPSTPCNDAGDPSNPNPDSFLETLSEEVWETKRRPVGHTAWECARDVCLMHSVAMNRRAIRLENGALVLNKPKLTFKLDEDGNPAVTSTYTIRDSNKLVEEYMLLANYLVAQEMIVRNGRSAFLRHHPPPILAYLDELKALSEHVGVPIDITSAKTLQESLKRITKSADPIVCKAVTALLMHPMQLARYDVVGSSVSESWRHYALSIPYYTHFTSPIRRYADVVVHRLLDLGLRDPEAARELSEDEEHIKVLHATAVKCNHMRLHAKLAQERSDTVFLSVYLADHPMYADGVVIGIGDKSFSVLLTDFGEESRLYVDDMPSVTAAFNGEAKTITLVRETAESGTDIGVAGSGSGGKGRSSTQDRNKSATRGGRDPAAVAKAYKFTEMTIGLLSPVVVYLSAKTTPPIDMCVDIVCAGRCADYTFTREETAAAVDGGSVRKQATAVGDAEQASRSMESLSISGCVTSGAADL